MGRSGIRGYGGVEREIIYLSLHCHHQNDFCIKMGSDESHFNVSLIVRDEVTRQCPQTTTSEVKGEPKRIQTKVLPLTARRLTVRPNWLTPCWHAEPFVVNADWSPERYCQGPRSQEVEHYYFSWVYTIYILLVVMYIYC